MRAQRAWTRYLQSASAAPGEAATTVLGEAATAAPGEAVITGPGESATARRSKRTGGNAVGRQQLFRRFSPWGWIRRLPQAAGWTERTVSPSSAAAEGPRHRDLRLVPAAAAAWITAAGMTRLDAVAAFWCAAGLLMIAVCCGSGCFLPGWARIRRVAGLCVVPLAVASLVGVCAAVAIGVRTAGPVLAAVQDHASITAVLRATADAEQISPDRFTGVERFLIEATLTSGTVDAARFTADTPILVIGQASWAGITSADTIRTAGRLVPTGPGDRAVALLVAGTSPQVESPSGWSSYPGELRNNFVRLTSQVAGEGGLLPGMVIGDRSGLSKSIEQDMQTTGLTHLTAVSGANCSYLLAFVFLAARVLNLPRLPAAFLGVLALVGFVILVRPEPSVLRAAVMGGIGVAAVLSGRGRVPLALLLLTIVILLAVDPWLNGTYAFMLSVAAASGLILFGPVLTRRLARFMPTPAAQLLAVPIAAQLFCAPIISLLQPFQPLYSVPANIAATPAVPFVTIVGMGAVALTALAEPLAVPLVLVAGWGADWVGAVAGFFSSAPSASLPWVAGVPGALLTGALAATVVLAVVFGPRLWAACVGLRRPGLQRKALTDVDAERPDRIASLPSGSRWRDHGRAGIQPVLWLAAGCAVGLVTVLLWPPDPNRPGRWQIAACDVGQGDAFALRTGEHSAILVDVGPEPDAVDACLDKLSITTVELLVLTHFHADHYGGIEGVFRDRTVQRILYSSTEPALPSVVYDSVVNQTGSQRPGPERLVQGMQGEHGDGGAYGRVSWTVLWPDAEVRPASENNSSAVLEVVIDTPDSKDVAVLLTGDLEEDAAQMMLRANPDLVERGVQILKVPHHGARNGGIKLAHAVRPQFAMISAGRENDYGHPHPTITAGLSAAGVTVARTDELGTFRVSIQENSLTVRR